MGIGDLFLQLGFRQRTSEVFDVGVAGGLEGIDRVLVHTFKKKEPDLALVERSLAHLRKPVSRRKNGEGDARRKGSLSMNSGRAMLAYATQSELIPTGEECSG
ncbi:hypothetical protein D3C79_988870 [compost metagenome]